MYVQKEDVALDNPYWLVCHKPNDLFIFRGFFKIIFLT